MTRDGAKHPRNTQYPIIALQGSGAELQKLITAARVSGLPYLGFIKEMIVTNKDDEISAILSEKDDQEMEYLAVGIFGDNEKIKSLTGKFKLWS